MKVSIISTSDLLTKELAEEIYLEINEQDKSTTYELSVNDNFINEAYNSGIIFILYLGGVFAEKIVEKIIENIVNIGKSKMKEKEQYDMNITINVNIDNSKHITNYNILTDIEKLKKDLLDAKIEKND